MKRRILIVDDTPKNIEAAKKAALEFPEVEFIFEHNSQKAFALILDPANDIHGIISDLLFPSEEKNDYFRNEFNDANENNLKEIDRLSRHSSEDERNACKKLLPLGLGLISEAFYRGKKIVLHTDIHRHLVTLTEFGKEEMGSMGYLYNGSIILKPLVDGGILKKEDVENDGENSLRYFGGCLSRTSNPLHGFEGSPPKDNKDRWVEVIKRCLAQFC